MMSLGMRFIAPGLTILAGLSLNAPVRADVLFQSIPDLTVAPHSAAVCSACYTNFQVYDDFNLAATSTISEIDFTVSSLAQPAITVGIYSLADGLPGSLIVSQTFSTYSYTSVGNSTEIADVFPIGWSLPAGSYDISFYNPATLKIASYAETGRAYYQSGRGLQTGYSTGFELIGSAVAAPEPASAALFGFALIGLAAVHRRQAAGARRRVPVRG
nr:PEP-CTERM sorting domain-containing protein [uncultured Rhodopila sp.]